MSMMYFLLIAKILFFGNISCLFVLLHSYGTCNYHRLYLVQYLYLYDLYLIYISLLKNST